MKVTTQISHSYGGRQVGIASDAAAQLTTARGELNDMIRDSGLASKIVSLIVPEDPLSGQGADCWSPPGPLLLTLWGRAPSSDKQTVSSLIARASEKFGKVFQAQDSGRFGPEGDIIVSPFTFDPQGSIPPRTWI